jgi:predicted transcriptional regulator of viral defense system
VTLVGALASLGAMEDPVFETGDAAVRLGISNAHASATLARLAAVGHLVRLRRGLWALPGRVDPLTLPARLTAPLPSYVSLQSALYLHGMISQVPAVTYAVSLARARQFETPLGVVSVHHVAPGFFFGYEDARRNGVLMASPEKALVDFFYLGPARSGLFHSLPELELPRGFKASRARAIVAQVPSRRRRRMVERALERVLESRRT